MSGDPTNREVVYRDGNLLDGTSVKSTNGDTVDGKQEGTDKDGGGERRF